MSFKQRWIQSPWIKTVIVFLCITSLESFFANFAHPVTPSLIINLKLPAYTFGLAFASMALTNFLFSPFWGRLSDRIGRLNLYLISLLGYALGQFLFMLAKTEWHILVARGVAGFFIGGVIVLQMAYLIDIVPKAERARMLSLQTALFSLTGSLGYLAGGLIGQSSIEAVFIVQVLGLALTGIVSRLILKESIQQKQTFNLRAMLYESNPFQAFRLSIKHLNLSLALFFMMVFLGVFGFIAFDQSFNYYVRDQLNLGPAYNGVIRASLGILGLVLNSTISLYLIRHTQLKKTLLSILALTSLSSWLMILPSSPSLLLGLSVLYFSFYNIVQVLVQVIASREVPHNETGAFMGFFSSVRSLGMIFGSLLSGFVYGIHPLMAFALTGFVMSLAFITYALSLRFQNIR